MLRFEDRKLKSNDLFRFNIEMFLLFSIINKLCNKVSYKIYISLENL